MSCVTFWNGRESREQNMARLRAHSEHRRHAAHPCLPACYLPRVSPIMQVHADMLGICANINRALRACKRRLARHQADWAMPSLESGRT